MTDHPSPRSGSQESNKGSSPWKGDVSQCFDAAASTYHQAAGTQRQIAEDLCRRVTSEPLAPSPDVLEIGCGTGFVTRWLQPRLQGCRWLATDVSPRMIEQCKGQVSNDVRFQLMDGEHPDVPPTSFDLVISSMSVQWFDDLGAGLRRLHACLRPGGLLAVTTLGGGTFHEWRELCRATGADPGAPRYSTPAGLRQVLGPEVDVTQRSWELVCDDVAGFLDHLTAIGARGAMPGQRRLPGGLLRKILKDSGGNPFVTHYDVLTVLWRRAA